jgi:signal transduction histidine kinase
VHPAGGLALVRRTRWRLAIRASVLVMVVLAVLSAGVWVAARQTLFGMLHGRLERAEQDAAPQSDVLVGPLSSTSTQPFSALDPDRDSDFSIISDPGYGLLAVLRGRDAAGKSEVLATSASDEVRALGVFAVLLGALTVAGGAAALPAAYLLAGRALRPLEEAIRERSDFVALASHRLRTPLAVIRTSAELALSRQGVGPEEALQTILAQGRDMEALAARLSALARSDGAPARRGATTDLGRVARDVASALGPAAERGGVEVRLEGPPVLQARGPEAEVTDALTSVLENAVRFSPRGGRVTVRTAGGGRWATVDVADQGPGIDPADLPRVTEPFVQGALGRTRGGTGLGLAIAAATLRRLDGRLQITSRPGAGTTVRMQFPRPPAAR